MSNSITHGPAIQTYLANDPRRINPFNKPHHRFIAGDDPGQDALYLKSVLCGETNRFYVTVASGTGRASLNVVILDKHNNNIVLSLPVKPNTRFLATYGGRNALLTAALDLLRSVASANNAELRIDLANLCSEDRDALTAMHENVVDANLFQEGFAAAAGEGAAGLWHDEQIRGYRAATGVSA